MSTTETWLPIKGYEHLYEVSDHGRVRNIKTGRMLKQHLNKRNKALQVGLFNQNTSRTFLVSRLVATTFIPNPEELPQVSRIDDDITNNAADNLLWCTTSPASRLKKRIPITVTCLITGKITLCNSINHAAKHTGRKWYIIQAALKGSEGAAYVDDYMFEYTFK